jgi:hypothetical protein
MMCAVLGLSVLWRTQFEGKTLGTRQCREVKWTIDFSAPANVPWSGREPEPFWDSSSGIARQGACSTVNRTEAEEPNEASLMRPIADVTSFRRRPYKGDTLWGPSCRLKRRLHHRRAGPYLSFFLALAHAQLSSCSPALLASTPRASTLSPSVGGSRRQHG